MGKFIIDKNLSRKLVMSGVKYKDNHPGGISSVVLYWSEYIEDLNYYAEFKEGSNIGKLYLFFRAYFLLLLRFIFDRKIKIVHVHTADRTDFKRNSYIVNLAHFFGKKILIHSHGAVFVEFYENANPKKKEWIKSILNKADKVIVLSESWKKWFAGISIDESKLVILHNITSFPKKVNVETNNVPVRLLFLGEIGERKGVFDIIRALGQNREKLEGKLELHIGGNKMEDELRKAIKDNHLEKIVTFDGFVAGEKKITLLNWANLFILPSFNEGLPISILEAMSYKLPIISSPVGGIPEVVSNDNGILVTPGNADEIFAAIYQYVEKPELIKSHGKSSYEKVSTYLPDYVLNHLKEIYEELLRK